METTTETRTATSRHEHTVQSTSDAWGYSGPVVYDAGVAYARRVGLDENRAAHGNVGFTDRCSCGYERRRLVNQRHVEVGPWVEGEDLIRERRDREERRAREQAATEQREALQRGVTLGGGVHVRMPEPDADDPEVLISIRGERRWVRASTLYLAASSWRDEPDSAPGVIYGSVAEALTMAQVRV